MPVAALYDIHGNLPALEAVLGELESESLDRVVVGGDVVSGPMPLETIEALLCLKVPVSFVMGNADAEVLAAMSGAVGSAVEAASAEVNWIAQQLEARHQRHIAGWRQTLSLEIPGLGSVLFCHATPRDNTEVFTRLTPDERLGSVFRGVAAQVVVCGHTHMQFERTVEGRRVINAGSVGMPYGPKGAFWVKLGPNIEFRRTCYNLERAATRIRATAYPGAAQFALENILHPPSAEEAVAYFESRALEAKAP